MQRHTYQSGFSVIEVVLALVVVAVLGSVGYIAYNQLHKKSATAATSATTSASATTQSPTATNVSSAPTVSSTSDLDKEQAILDQNDPSATNSSDSDLLNSQSSF